MRETSPDARPGRVLGGFAAQRERERLAQSLLEPVDVVGVHAESLSLPSQSVKDQAHPQMTPDGRYIVVRGRLWRATNPNLSDNERQRLTAQLMDARRRLRGQAPADVRATARASVDAAKVGLGERGPVWWTDGEPDFNRRVAKNTPYAVWYAILQEFA